MTHPSEVLADLERIRELRHRYCWAYDDGDAELLGSLFTADGRVDLGDWGRFRGSAEIVEGFRGQVSPPGSPRTTLHTLSTEVLEVDGSAATGRWYVVVYHLSRAGEAPVRFVGRYLDTYSKSDGAWKFTSIRLEQFWFAGY
jgi:hypothetical protein